MRVDIRHLMTKGELAKVVARCMAYAATMRQQRKPLERIVVSESVYTQLMRKAAGHAPGRRVVLCCGDALVHFDAHAVIDESEPEYTPRPRFNAELPPVAVNPFGVAIPAPKSVDDTEPEPWDDDDSVPF